MAIYGNLFLEDGCLLIRRVEVVWHPHPWTGTLQYEGGPMFRNGVVCALKLDVPLEGGEDSRKIELHNGTIIDPNDGPGTVRFSFNPVRNDP
jgi:hypothetical protein